MATLEEIQPHRISQKPRVFSESSNALMSSQYFCGKARPDSSHNVPDVQIRDQHREMQRIRALIDCGATSIFISPQLLNRLGLHHEAAHITTHGLTSQVIAHANESCKTAMMVQYMDHSAPLHKPEVLVIPMRAYDIVLGLRWLKPRKPDIDWATGRLTSLRTPSGQGEAGRSGIIVQWYEGWYDESTKVRLLDIVGSKPMINSTSQIPVDPNGKPTYSGEDSPTPDIEIFGANAFDDLSASDETIETFALRIGECSGLLGATMEATTLEDPGEIETINPKRWTSKQGAAALVAAEEEPHSGIVE